METKSSVRLRSLVKWSILGMLWVQSPTGFGLEIHEKLLPNGMKREQAEKLGKAVSKKRSIQQKLDQRQRDELLGELKLLSDKVQTQMKKVLDQNPVLKKRHLGVQAEFKKIQESNLSIDRKMQLTEQLHQKNRELMDTIMRLSAVDEPLFIRQTQIIVQKHYRKHGKKMRFKYWGYFGYSLIGDGESEMPAPSEFEEELRAPFPLEESEYGLGGRTDIDAERGMYYAGSTAVFANMTETIAGLGHFFRVPQGFGVMRVSARLPETYYNLFAEAFVGFSTAWAKTEINIETEDGEGCNRQREHELLIAPVLWFATRSGEDNVVLTCEISNPQPNQDVVISFHSLSGVFAAVGAASVASVSAEPDVIRVRMIP